MLFSSFKFLGIIEENIPMIHAEKFHRHAGHFGYFHWIFLERIQFERMSQKRLNRMSAFMYHCRNIMHRLSCVHKNKWCTTFCQRHVVSTRSFATAAFQIKMMHRIHLPQAIAEERTNPGKAFNGFVEQFFPCLKWCEWFCAFWFRFHILWAELFELKFLFFMLVNFCYQRHYMFLYRIMKLKSILFGIIKTAKFFKFKIPVIFE